MPVAQSPAHYINSSKGCPSITESFPLCFLLVNKMSLSPLARHCQWRNPIRALSTHSVAEFKFLPGRWQHVWLVAIVPLERWGTMDRNDCHTAWGNLKTLISSLHHYLFFFINWLFFVFLFLFHLCYMVSPSTGCKSQLF
jgi:hypothetical protein